MDYNKYKNYNIIRYMNKKELQNFLDAKRHILAIASGILGGSIPNNKSNMPPILTGGIFAGLIVKIIYGDYDIGYKWTSSDILFWIITIFEGIIGAFIISSI